MFELIKDMCIRILDIEEIVPFLLLFQICACCIKCPLGFPLTSKHVFNFLYKTTCVVCFTTNLCLTKKAGVRDMQSSKYQITTQSYFFVFYQHVHTYI